MNARSPLPFFLIAALAAGTACDRRETTGTSDVHREGQGETPETAQDLRETATPTPPSDQNPDTPATVPSPEAPAAPTTPPVDHAPPVQDTKTQDAEGDTLGRP